MSRDLNEISEIEGLDHDQDYELINDTNPEAILVKFEAISEYMPYLSEHSSTGSVYKTFVYRYLEKDLGRTVMRRRIRDKVELVDGKWKVISLAKNGQSDIKKFTKAWNMFARGNTDAIQGTPIALLFRADPSRAENYTRNHVDSIERLAALPDGEVEHLGMGAFDDRARARAYLARAKEAAAGIEFNAQFREMKDENSSLKAQIADLSEKLTKLLSAQLEAEEEKPRSRRRAPAETVTE
jgi:hypothetical protein